jgi:hypothetical protein
MDVNEFVSLLPRPPFLVLTQKHNFLILIALLRSFQD